MITVMIAEMHWLFTTKHNARPRACTPRRRSESGSAPLPPPRQRYPSNVPKSDAARLAPLWTHVRALLGGRPASPSVWDIKSGAQGPLSPSSSPSSLPLSPSLPPRKKTEYHRRIILIGSSGSPISTRHTAHWCEGGRAGRKEAGGWEGGGLGRAGGVTGGLMQRQGGDGARVVGRGGGGGREEGGRLTHGTDGEARARA